MKAFSIFLILPVTFLLLISLTSHQPIEQKNSRSTTVSKPLEYVNIGPDWPAGKYFPYFTSAKKIYILEVNCPIFGKGPSSDPNWRIDQSQQISASLTLVGMQGIINREEARLYIHWQDTMNPEGVTAYNQWTALVAEHANTETLQMNHQAAIQFLWNEFSHLFKGIVVYDTDVPETINLATMIAGLEDRIIVGPHQLNLMPFDTISEIRDLQPLVDMEGWKADFDSQLPIYQWVYDNLWPDLEHRMIGFASPGPPTSIDRETINDGFFFPLAIAHKDYDVALKLPVLYLNPKYDDHKALLEKFFQDAPSPIPVLGPSAFNEHGVVELASKYGNFVPAISWPGQTMSCGNLTVLSSIRPDIIKNGPDLSPDKILATVQQPGPFVTLFDSDGDALFFLMDQGFYPFFKWDDVKGQPFNWETNPLLADLAPIIWNHYQKDRNGTYSIAGVSGIGYTRPQLMDSLALDKYLSIGAPYLKQSGLRVLRIDGTGGPVNERISKQYYQHLKESNYLGSIISFLPGSTAGLNLKYLDNPAPLLQETFTMNAQNKVEIIADLSNRTPHTSKMEIFINGNNDDVLEVPDDSASNGIAVLVKKEFFQSPSYSLIYSSGPITLEPGNYKVTHYLKVSENTNNTQIANLYAGQNFSIPDWTLLGTKSVSSNEFENPKQYQAFSYEFILTDLTTEVEFRIDYGQGSTDLWVDYILLENDNPDLLPVFAPLYMSLGIAPSLFSGMNTLAKDFAKDFDVEGSLILSGNEFFAALNPEYMIEFAGKYDHDETLLNLAKDQLAKGEYYRSLISVRKSLKSSTLTTSISAQTVGKDQLEIYPNPFFDVINCGINLDHSQFVSIKIFDLQGRLIKIISEQHLSRGKHTFKSFLQLKSNIYLIHLQMHHIRETHKIVKL